MITLMRDTVTDKTLWIDANQVEKYKLKGYVVEEEARPDTSNDTSTLSRNGGATSLDLE